MLCSSNGFGCSMTFEDINDEDIDDTENFVRTKLSRLLNGKNGGKLDDNVANAYFGSYWNDPGSFRYSSEERRLILASAQFAKYLAQIGDINDSFSRLGIDDNSVVKSPGTNISSNSAGHCLESSKSRTHYFLGLLKASADQNVERKKEGYRFDETVKKLACYYRMIAGPMAYESLQRNLDLSLPSISSVNRHIRRINTNIVEGVLRENELHKYLEERGLPLVVVISEDATRLTGTVQYDVRTNQIMGFALPINHQTGMPIPYTFEARNAYEMVKYFKEKNVVGNNINVVMAQPLANVPAFCVLLYVTDNSYTAFDVSSRFKYIVERLRAVNIEVLVVSSDSDPKYNSAMRRDSMLGAKSSLFGKGIDIFIYFFSNTQLSSFFEFYRCHILQLWHPLYGQTVLRPRLCSCCNQNA